MCLHCLFLNIEKTGLYHKAYQIPELKCFSSRLTVVFAQSIEAMCLVENENLGDARASIKCLTILLSTKVWLVLEVWW